MKLSIFSAALLTASVNGHGMWQKLKVNGVDQGQSNGISPPSSNNPVQVVSGASIACNTGLKKSNTVITVPAGAKVASWFQHVIGGAQYANDADNPIAASHKGPIQVYLAKVDDAATASNYNALSWFKIAEEGLNTQTGKWAVDTMIAGQGWWEFTMPTCVAPGQYLMRIELLALHSAYSSGAAQFYMSCANIQVTGSGTSTGSQLVKFPGAYSANDPGIMLNIYSSGKPSVPNNDGKPYKIPGPAKLQC
ncbi:endoglucanase II [Glarea lozoyensis ATCC 20868]|uniref:AA9 family lytic polysaccharide monooxygenase n=1 Tax=Glarea lozoyensis (strain ATCC 20868 / MF5171) TaxID=1116229 RepID=S3CEM7_GLAL2|nr:endoglucanase II [Glarea lozoyensis ATCC 20868]EPE24460.1 endoglucanase II [Glarea lozoyensis ATCC 20868]